MVVADVMTATIVAVALSGGWDRPVVICIWSFVGFVVGTVICTADLIEFVAGRIIATVVRRMGRRRDYHLRGWGVANRMRGTKGREPESWDRHGSHGDTHETLMHGSNSCFGISITNSVC
jgi:hypothetical protein